MRFPHKSDPIADFWLIVFMVIGFCICYILYKLTGGYLFKYRKANISKNLNDALSGLHIVGSSIIAFALPNTVLNKFTFFQNLFEENIFWIPVIMLLLLIICLIILGLILAPITNYFEKK